MSRSQDHLTESIERSAETIRSLHEQTETIEIIRNVVIGALAEGGKILTAGHGGSAADALHMAEELVGRFERDRRSLPAVCLVADPTLLTCIGNDYGFERLFARQIEGLGAPGDVLVIFSTSGNGEGLRLAAEAARERGVTSIALLGKGGGPLRERVDYPLIIASNETARIQEAHTLILHLILEAVDQRFAE